MIVVTLQRIFFRFVDSLFLNQGRVTGSEMALPFVMFAGVTTPTPNFKPRNWIS